jgi:hypothetical protein
MTDEEADALDEYYTKNPPRVDPRKNGGFAKKSFRMITLDDFSAEYITSKALATRQTPEEIIHKLISRELSAITS